MHRTLIFITCLTIMISSAGQSKKEIKKNKIKSATDWEITFVNGKANTYKSAYEEFDKNGRSILKVEYGPDGGILTKVTTKYDGYDNKIEETDFDASKKKNVRRTYKYNAFRDKTEESEYSSSGVLLKKTLFTYNGDGNRTSEITTDAAGTMQKKTTYSYNAKKLRSGKQTLNSTSVPESGKKWEYEYY
jgi:hypothetical protein